MVYHCIGKRIEGGNGRGRVEVQCSNFIESETPPYPTHPNWPYLCPSCANASPNRLSRRSQLRVETEDVDHPNTLEDEAPELYHGNDRIDQDEQDRLYLDNLEELDLF